MSHRYFVDYTDGSTALLEGDDAYHLAKSMRARPGDLVVLCDGDGTDYTARILSVDPKKIELTIVESHPNKTEPKRKFVVYAGVSKGGKMETVIQKATELGAIQVTPFISRFCVVKPKNEDAKLNRYARIAKEAAQQSNRGRIPHVMPTIPFVDVLAQAKQLDLALFFFEGGGETLIPGSELHHRINRSKSIAIITGAEGGFSPEEKTEALAAGCVPVFLGPRILRCETAPLAGLAAVMTLAGELV